MRITFHGAAQTVTGSQYVLEINGSTLLLECGLYQGRRQEAAERNRSLGFNPKDIDAVILSHAHIDHSGNLPTLVRDGFRGHIYATHATAHLSNIMLMDAGYIQESDAKFVNKRNAKAGLPLVEPLYTQEDAAMVAQYFESMDYDEPFEPAPGVVARLVDAGHILGSASVVMEIEEKGQKHTLWFSGDIGRRKLPLLLTFLASLVVYVALSKAGGHPGWWPHFYFSCVEMQNSLIGFHPDFSLGAFLRGYARGGLWALFQNFWPWLFVKLGLAARR